MDSIFYQKNVLCKYCKYKDDCDKELSKSSWFGELGDTECLESCSYGELDDKFKEGNDA